MSQNPGKVRRMPARKVKSQNLANLHVINTNVAVSCIPPTGTINTVITRQQSSAFDASSEPKAMPPIKASPLKEKVQQKGDFSLAKKVVDKAKSFLTDLQLQSTSKEHYRKGNVSRNMTLRQAKTVDRSPIHSLNRISSSVKKNTEWNESSKKLPDPLRDSSLNPKKPELKKSTSPNTSSEFPERDEKRVVRMKQFASDSRRDLIEHERRAPVTRQSSRRYSREFLDQRVISKKDTRGRNYEEERKRPSTSRRFSSRREEQKYYEERYQSSRREREKRSRNYEWDDNDFRDSSPYHWYRKDYKSSHHSPKVLDNLEEVSDGPMDDTDFEEVEVASVEEAEKSSEIPVGFRKYQVKYLSYRCRNFFKPKIFNICSERTVVNCLNVKGNDSVEVDVVSEAEYECGNDPLKLNQDKTSNNDNVTENTNNNVKETVKVGSSSQVEGKIVREEDQMSDNEIVVIEETNVSDIPIIDLSSEESCCEGINTVDSSLVEETKTAVLKGTNIVNFIKQEPVYSVEKKIEALNSDEERTKFVNSVEEITDNMISVKEKTTDVNSVKKKTTNVNSVKEKTTNVYSVEEKTTDVNSVKEKITNLNSIKEKITDVNSVKETMTDVNSAVKLTKDMDSFAKVTKTNVSFAKSSNSAVTMVENKNIVDSSPVQNVNATDSFNKIINMELDDSSTDEKSRIYCKCIPEKNANQDFHQGAAKIQSHLDAWQSHLIGLEYIIEVQDNLNETNVKKYHCWLCSEDIWYEATIGQTVIGHINSYRHMLDYMAKHFPSCGYKFSESVRSYNSEIVLRKCCEEINRKIGYYFMCITNLDYFSNHKKDIKELLDAMMAFKKSDINIDVSVHLSELESAVSKEISAVIDDIIDNILPVKGISTFISARKKARRSNVCKDIHISNSNESLAEGSSESGRTLILLTPREESPPLVLKIAHVAMPTVTSALKHKNLVQVPTQEITPSQLVTLSADITDRIESESKISPKQNISADKTENSVTESIAPKEDRAVPKSFTNFTCKQANSFRKYLSLHSALSSLQPDVRPARKVVKESNIPVVQLKDDDIEMKPKSEEVIQNEEEPVILNKNDNCSSPAVSVADSETNFQKEENFISLSTSKESDPVVDIPIEPVEKEVVPKSKSSKQRSHQKSTLHSKYCIKRILSRSTKSHKEASTKKDAPSKESDSVDSVNESVVFEEKYSSSGKMIDELNSQDSRHSSSSAKRERSPSNRSSRSPSLPYKLLQGLSRSRSRSPNERSIQIRSSPHRKQSRSPVRFNRNPIKRRSKSPIRRFSRSPLRRNSRSPVARRSRSPIRKRSRSPLGRRSRSPLGRRSRSPLGRRSRSPLGRRSRSPLRRRSRSPLRRRSRSPLRRRSRSPLRRRSRSPLRIASRLLTRQRPRSSYRRLSRRLSKSPVRRKSKSPIRRSPSKRHSLNEFRNVGRSLSSYWKDSSSFKSSKRPESSTGSRHRSSKYSVRSKHVESEVGRSVSDLDSISDEDESAYFATTEKFQHLEEIMKLPEPTRSMIMQILKKYCGPNMKPSDPLFSEFMQFVNTNSDALQQFVGTQSPSNISDLIAGKQAPNKVSRDAYRHQYLMSNLVGNSAKPTNVPFPTPVPGSSGIPFPPPSVAPPPFQPPTIIQYPRPSGIPSIPPHAYPQHGLSSTSHQHMPFQSNQFTGVQQHNQPLPRQINAPSEIAFKDLKATVNKLFGANEGTQNQGALNESVAYPSTSGFIPNQEPAKWVANPPNVSQTKPGDFYNHDGTLRSHSSFSVNYPKQNNPQMHYKSQVPSDMLNVPRLPVPPPDTKVSFCDAPSASSNRNLFPVVSKPDTSPGSNVIARNTQSNVSVAKISLAQRLAAVLVKFGMVDVSASLLQEMLMKIGAFSINPPQDINEAEIVDILKRLGYLL